MKVYLSNEVKSKSYHFTYRLRRNISHIYTSLSIDVIDKINMAFDFAHFVDISQKKEINYVKDVLKKKVIFSYFVQKASSKVESISQLKIPLEDKRVLNKCDLIFVSCQADKMVLIANEVNVPIEILAPGIREERFTEISEIEKSAFFKYASLIEKEKFALGLISYKNEQDIKDLITISKGLQNIKLFIFGPKTGLFSLSWKIRKLIKKAPKNLIFKSYVNQDVFKSAMLESKFFIVTRESEKEILTILEAMITKTQIFTFNNHYTGDFLIDNVNCILSLNGEDMVKDIVNYMEKGNNSTIEEAYKQAKKLNFEEISKEAKRFLDKYVDLKICQ